MPDANEPRKDKSLLDIAAQAAADATRIATNPAEAVGAALIAGQSIKRTVEAVAFGSGGDAPEESLRRIGDEMLYQSWKAPDETSREHPAFRHILGEITPDEARVLRFLAVAGPQPSIDVRTNTLFGIGSQRLAAGVNFIADMAGCAYPARGNRYLGNLNRLGLIRFSSEPVDDFRRYALLDAHPDAVAATKRGVRTIAKYRSVYLSVFGTEFCAECFTLDDYDGGGWADRDRRDSYWGKGPRLP